MSVPPPDEQPTFLVLPAEGTAPDASAAPPKKRRWRYPLLLIVVVMIGCCVCVAACVVLAGSLIFKGITENIKIERRVESFMDAMEAQDTAHAYTMFSAHAQQEISLADVEALAQGDSYVLFEGYQSVKITNTKISTQAGADPQTTAEVSGTVSYAGGFEGDFRATLEKYGKHWYLYSIDITVPPEKPAP